MPGTLPDMGNMGRRSDGQTCNNLLQSIPSASSGMLWYSFYDMSVATATINVKASL